MKPIERSPGLRRFSSDEHRWLALARDILRAAAEGAATRELALEVGAQFARELAPHMAAEERHLLPLLERTGERGHAERTRAEHRGLRALAVRLQAGEASALVEFAEALKSHIRYEERELWAAAERAVPAAVLATLARRDKPESGDDREADVEPE